jgi:predicted small lipoprotein YifL
MNRIFRIAFIAAVLATLAGCGNKGPLFLPSQPPPVDPATAPAVPAQDEPVLDTPAAPTPATPAPTDEPAPTTVPAPDEDGNG